VQIFVKVGEIIVLMFTSFSVVLIFWFNIVFVIMGGQLDELFVSLAACFLQIN